MRLTALAAAWLAGLAIAHRWFDSEPLLLLPLFGIALTIGLLCRLLTVAAWPALLVAVCLLGIWRYEVSETGPSPLLLQTSGTTRVHGLVASDPEATSTRIKFVLRLTSIEGRNSGPIQSWEHDDTRILVYAHPAEALVENRDFPYFRYGDSLALSGALQRPEPIEQFDYPAYLESQGIYGVFWAEEVSPAPATDSGTGLNSYWNGATTQARVALYDLRRHIAGTLESSLSPSQASLAQALLLGMRGQLPAEVSDNFRLSGTAHLLAISGLHLGILLLLTVGALHGLMGQHTPVPLLLALLTVWLYVGLSGAPPSVVRAAIMGSVYLAALGLGRPRESLLPALALSAGVMTALDPSVVGQISFQLSFAAMSGIALALPLQEAAASGIRNQVAGRWSRWGTAAGISLGWVTSGTIVSAAATVVTFPLVALNFGQIPLLGIPATLVATPILPFALVGGIVTAACGVIHPVLGQLVGIPAAIPLTTLLFVVELTPKWVLPVPLESWDISWAWYGVFLILLVAADSRTCRSRMARALSRISGQGGGQGTSHQSPPNTTFFALAGLGAIVAAAAVIFFAELTQGGDGLLHVHFLDVGQGDGIFIVTPGGRQALVDGGPQFGGGAAAISSRMAPWDRSLDLVASTHLDDDHSRGLLNVLEHYRTGWVAIGVQDKGERLYRQWNEAVEGGGHRLTRLSAGDTLELDEEVRLEVLHPPRPPLRGPAWDSNNNSLVLRLVYGKMSFLLTGDIESEAEQYLVKSAQDLESQVLKAGHHGSKSSTTPAFLKAVNPRWVVISAGEDNQFGHPHKEVIDRLGSAVGEENIFSTTTQGSIHFSTDGRKLWVDTEL